MKRKTVRWVIGAAAGLVVSSSLAAGTAQAADTGGGLLPAGGAGQMLPVGAVTSILPVGK